MGDLKSSTTPVKQSSGVSKDKYSSTNLTELRQSVGRHLVKYCHQHQQCSFLYSSQNLHNNSYPWSAVDHKRQDISLINCFTIYFAKTFRNSNEKFHTEEHDPFDGLRPPTK